ncbi:transcriptional regulator [Fuscovulum ytuae]|uniref:Transcriptional regulator n=1 Tax=Fuscovulum ytuae TaxID=3042299 RepID=A0ABY8Q3N4_9RHOB|nr:transcriptional regulator [Fuscovulum sp. YMD61]WGV14706.1 transcriptional regulator [Fuscovulum sp. YMD61]
MARPRSIPDAVIFDAVLEMLEARGQVSFGLVSAAVGLAPPSLVQRYGDREGMLRGALIHGWDGVEAATRAADTAEASAQGFLKALGAALRGALIWASLGDEVVAARAAAWRAEVEASVARKAGCKAEAAAMIFAAWQGRMLWSGAGGAGFRLRDAVKRIG